MKTLLVLRHAKSSWDDQSLDDHARPLNPRGLKDAPRVGEWLREQGVIPDVLITSDAVRARMTAEAVARAAGYTGDVRLDSSLYLASPDEIYGVINTVDRPRTAAVMIVGHNPGLSAFVTQLTGDDVELPTAALAQIVLPIADWADLDGTTRGTLVALWRPGER
jgi:phosphohistidine phosphatase